MSESLPFVETLVSQMDPNGKRFINNVVRAALHALIAHCRADRTGKPDLPVAANHPAVPESCDTLAGRAKQRSPEASPTSFAAVASVLETTAAPASASARAEAMQRLREAIAKAPDGHVLGPVWGNLTDAARAVLALPEPDECAPLRLLLEWLDNDGTFIRSHNAMREEVRRLIAERGGKP